MFEKLIMGSALGGVLGIFCFFESLHEGKSWGESFQVFFGSIVLVTLGVLWFTRNMGDDSAQSSVDPEIRKLQNQLVQAAQAEADYVAKGRSSDASYWHSQVVLIESQLRRLGA